VWSWLGNQKKWWRAGLHVCMLHVAGKWLVGAVTLAVADTGTNAGSNI
jgi:hypothetical protein